jgi:mycofactocin precursor
MGCLLLRGGSRVVNPSDARSASAGRTGEDRETRRTPVPEPDRSSCDPSPTGQVRAVNLPEETGKCTLPSSGREPPAVLASEPRTTHSSATTTKAAPMSQATNQPTNQVQPTEESDDLVDDSLVEEISIDGMCGVY